MEIKLQEALFSDGRFMSVVKKIGQVNAIGNYVVICSLAQNYWKRGRKLIPKNIWSLAEFPMEFIEFELVDEKEDGYYLHGSREFLHDDFITNVGKISKPIEVKSMAKKSIEFDFLDDELKAFISSVSDRYRSIWVDKYDKQVLFEKITDCFEWCRVNDKKPKGSVTKLINQFLKDAPKKPKFDKDVAEELDRILDVKE